MTEVPMTHCEETIIQTIYAGPAIISLALLPNQRFSEGKHNLTLRICKMKLFLFFAVSILLMKSCLGDVEKEEYECFGKHCPLSSLPVDFTGSTIPCNGTEHYLKDPEDCRRYYYCKEGNNETAIHFKCPPGYGFDEEWENCVPEHMIKNCSSVYCPLYIYDGVVPDPENCAAYYRCTYGFSFHNNCPKGAVFKPETGICEDYDDSNPPECLKKPEEGSTTTTTTTEGSTTTTEGLTTMTGGSTSTTEGATTTMRSSPDSSNETSTSGTATTELHTTSSTTEEALF